MIRKPKPGAQRFVALAVKIAPAERRAWFEAMAAELDHVPEARRGHFAFGCLLVAVRERLTSPQFLNAAARSLLIGGAVAWAALNIRFAGRMSVSDAIVLEAFGYIIATMFAVGALATARFGYRATITLAAPLMAVLAVAAALIRFGSAATPTSNLYLALVVEDLLVLACALLVAGAAARIATARQAIR